MEKELAWAAEDHTVNRMMPFCLLSWDYECGSPLLSAPPLFLLFPHTATGVLEGPVELEWRQALPSLCSSSCLVKDSLMKYLLGGIGRWAPQSGSSVKTHTGVHTLTYSLSPLICPPRYINYLKCSGLVFCRSLPSLHLRRQPQRPKLA